MRGFSVKAFSLIEVMITIVIAALAMLPMISFLISGYKITNAQVDNAFAINLADSALNLAKAAKFSLLSEANAASGKTLPLSVKFPGTTTSTTYNVPIGPLDASKKGEKITHEASITTYYLKLELKKITSEADNSTTIFNYGKVGYKSPTDANVSTFTAQYSTKQEIFVIWATATMVQNNVETTTQLTTLIADMGS